MVQTNGFGFSFQVVRIAQDGSFEGSDAEECASSDGLLGDPSEPALHEVEPRSAGRSQMEMEAWMLGEPLSDRRVLVGAVVVADQVDLFAPVLSVEDLEEGQELLMRVLTEAALGDLAGGDLQSRKETGGSVPNVVVSHPCGKARAHRQDRLRAIQRLDLRLLVDAEHQRLLRRVQIEPDDVGHLSIEVRIRAELEGFHSMRLQPVLLPDAVDRHVADLQLTGQAARAPVGGRLRGPHRRGYDPGLVGRRYLPGPSAAMPRMQSGQPLLEETAPPLAHGHLGKSKSLRHRPSRSPRPRWPKSPRHAWPSAAASTALEPNPPKPADLDPSNQTPAPRIP